MKRTEKRLLINSCLAFIMILTFCLATTTAYATTTISNISIKVEKNDWEQTNNPGITVTGTGYKISDESISWSKNVSDCYPSEQIVVTMQLETLEGYSFKDTLKKSSFKITNASIESFEYSAGNILLSLSYDVRGIASEPEDLYWDGSKARWDMPDELRDKVRYDVKIVGKNGRNSTVVAENISDRKVNLYDWLASDPYYWEDYVRFRVRAIPKTKYEGLIKSSSYAESEDFLDWDIIAYNYGTSHNSGSNNYFPEENPNYNQWWWESPYPSYTRTEGWQYLNGIWYYIKDSKYVTNKFYDVDGVRYYFDSTGRMVTGWYKINNVWYLFDSSGAMLKNRWVFISNNWYWLQSDGKMKTGWFDWAGNTYYLRQSSGEMLTGWQIINGVWYYFSSEKGGALARSTAIPSADGRFWYFMRDDGALQTGWIDPDGYGWMYVDPETGCYQTGEKQIGGVWHNFNQFGRLVW